MQRTITRRRALAGIGSIAAGGTALAIWPRESAAISVVGIDLADSQTVLAPSERVTGVRLAVDAEYEYSSSHAVDRRTVDLSVDVNGVGYERLARVETADAVAQEVLSQAVALDADLLDHSGLSAGMFDVDTGQTTTTFLDVRLDLRLFKNGGEVARADAEATGVRLEISKESVTVSAQVGGRGELSVSRGTVTA